MKDVQSGAPEYCIPIHRVGITNLKLPIFVSDQARGVQHTVADIDVFVDLEETEKGTHMSRLALVPQSFLDVQINTNILKDIASNVRMKCKAKTSQVIYKFPYFIKKMAPVSKEPGLVHYDISLDITDCEDTHDCKTIISIGITATSLCPCSKEISESGAHNQRSKIWIKFEPKDFIWFEDIIKIAEESASCQIYSTLKRPDEKYVTEYAYDNPRFVEDMVREIFAKLHLSSLPIKWYEIEVTNEESIHQHNAYAKMKSC